VRLVRESKAFQRARTLSRDNPERPRLFRAAREQHAFSDFALQAYAQPFGHAWLGEHLDSHVLQKLASRAYGAANRLLVGQAKRVRFKGRHQLDSVEGKTNATGLRWCVDHLEWSGLVVPARLDPRDLVVIHGLSCPVKYVRLVRRKVGLCHRFYAQLVCEGRPYRKAQHPLGQGIVGLEPLTEHDRDGGRAGGAAPALLPRGDPQLAAPAPPGAAPRSAAPCQQPGAL
jgi:hypothetical protein